jgi:phosphatidylglycerophosphatase A
VSLRNIFLTFGGIGRLGAPELPATLTALALGTALILTVGAESLFTLAFALFLVGIFEINKFENAGGAHDDRSIVIDEAVGAWVALSVGVHGIALAPALPYPLPFLLLILLGSYHYFDRRKPSTIGWIARNLKGGLGVMLDDVLAGFASGMSALLIFKIYGLYGTLAAGG